MKKILTLRDVSLLLNKPETELISMANNGTISSFKEKDEYIRFNRADIIEFIKKNPVEREKITISERFFNFLYFNDFYIIACVIMVALVAAVIFF